MNSGSTISLHVAGETAGKTEATILEYSGAMR
jgi:hypothetical protein